MNLTAYSNVKNWSTKECREYLEGIEWVRDIDFHLKGLSAKEIKKLAADYSAKNE